jgi:hypothetical protein
MSSLPARFILGLAKEAVPKIFELPSPSYQPKILDFLQRPSKFKSLVVFRGGGKTTTVNKIEVPIVEIIHNKEPFVQIFSEDEDKAISFLKDMKTMLLNIMKLGYFGMRIPKDPITKKTNKWKTKDLSIEIWDSMSSSWKYCYVSAHGILEDTRGSSEDFERPSLIIFDDVESTTGYYAIGNANNRKKLRKKINSDIIPSLTATGRVFFIGTILHEDSYLNRTLLSDRWDSLSIPLITLSGKSSWKSKHPMTRAEANMLEKEYTKRTGKEVEIEAIEEIRARFFEAGEHHNFYNEYMNKAMAEEKKLFREDMFRYFERVIYSDDYYYIPFKNAKDEKEILIRKPTGVLLEDGTTIPFSSLVTMATNDFGSFSSTSDDTCIILCGYDKKGFIYVLDILAGKWTPFEKSCYAIQIQREYKPLKYGAETGGMQNDLHYILDVAMKETRTHFNLEPVSHGGRSKNKRIARLHPLYKIGKILHNRSLGATLSLEAELLSFNEDMEGKKDNYIDALAQQLDLTLDEEYEELDYDDEDDFVEDSEDDFVEDDGLWHDD